MDYSVDPSPGSPDATPCYINFCWYVAGTPSPAILGFPSCERLEIMRMNCANTVIQNASEPLSPAPSPTTPLLQKKPTQLGLQMILSKDS